ncbi:ABC transporter permease [Paracoccus sp. JM45]|uniref:ABC transporter permease n=1 Tax=Paracoccus sp. JM45 TaxID=2283626 RepID=UPI00210697D4|nr:ABC transporter permease [Paracoccus sp. JM45]
MMNLAGYRLARRDKASRKLAVVAPVVALLLSIALNFALYMAMGKNPVAVFQAMLIEPVISWPAFSEVLLKMTPLLLIAQGLAAGFRAKVINIGAEGQFILGAIFASAVPVWFPQISGLWVWPLMIVLGGIGGMLWAVVPAIWRVRLNASEILVTLMMSLIAAQLLNFLLVGPWKDPMGFNFPQSVIFPLDATLPLILPGTRVNVALAIALIWSVACWVYLQRSFQGYQLMVGGLAPQAAGYAGYSQSRAVWMSLLIGGLAAGLAGASEVAGPVGQLQRSIASGYGYSAIIVAYLGGLHPVGIVFSSLLIAILYIGGDNAMVSAGLPVAAVRVFQGSLLVCYLAAITLVRYRVIREPKGIRA